MCQLARGQFWLFFGVKVRFFIVRGDKMATTASSSQDDWQARRSCEWPGLLVQLCDTTSSWERPRVFRLLCIVFVVVIRAAHALGCTRSSASGKNCAKKQAGGSTTIICTGEQLDGTSDDSAACRAGARDAPAVRQPCLHSNSDGDRSGDHIDVGAARVAPCN